VKIPNPKDASGNKANHIKENDNQKLDVNQFNEEDLDRNADARIKELQYKLQTLKFQNDIVLDENAKLLEILHLYKVIQSIESNEKNRILKDNNEDSKHTFSKENKNNTQSEYTNRDQKYNVEFVRNEMYHLQSNGKWIS
jgi:hypothetical protein